MFSRGVRVMPGGGYALPGPQKLALSTDWPAL